MKIVLIILCAFLLKTETEAQTWWNISPKNMDVIKKMQTIEATDGKMHLLVNSDTTVYSLVDGKKWNVALSISEFCFVQGNPPIQDVRFVFSSIFPTENDTLYIVYDGFLCGSTDANKTIVKKTTMYDLIEYRQDSLFTTSGGFGAKHLGLFDAHNKTKYLFGENWGQTYFTTFSDSGYDFQNVKNLKLGRGISDLFLLDSRNSEVYVSVRSDSSFKRNDTLWHFKLESLYKKSLTDSTWKFLMKLPVREARPSNTFVGGVYDLSFHSINANETFIASGQGLWRYNDTTNQIDTLLKIPTRSIFFKENSDIAYAGTESGEIYRSTDTGETWSLFASGFSTKPIIGIHASGNDSLIVGTEDGIWTNYQLPVSVTEEIPFKNNELTITPNPANSSLKISFLKTDVPQQLSIYNSLGQLVFKTEFSGEFTWDFKNDVPDGVYTVAVQFSGKSVAKQVVILK